MSHDVAESVLTPLRFLERSAQVWAERPAVVSGERTFTYAEHHERDAAARPARCGSSGSSPATASRRCCRTCTRCSSCTTPCPAIGAVLVPLNTRLTADDYAYILEHSGARLVFADPELAELRRRPRRRSPTTSR